MRRRNPVSAEPQMPDIDLTRMSREETIAWVKARGLSDAEGRRLEAEWIDLDVHRRKARLTATDAQRGTRPPS